MATTGADKLFVDTNVLIHATIPAASLHQVARERLEENYQAGTEIWISRQILREFVAALTRPQPISPALPVSTVIAEARFYEMRFTVANEGCRSNQQAV